MAITCTTFRNVSCLKCGECKGTMVSIGAFAMCGKCWAEEFNTQVIEPNTEVSANYYVWLKKYMEQ